MEAGSSQKFLADWQSPQPEMIDESLYAQKHAAILYADVVGYSRLTQHDAQGTHRTLVSVFKTILDLARRNNGRLVNADGDSVLAEFASVDEAIVTALQLQQVLDRINDGLGEGTSIVFRYGVAYGQINIDAGYNRIFGTTVNIAARLETLSSPGCVCVNRATISQLSDRFARQFKFLGEFELKNIAGSEQVYQFDLRTSEEVAGAKGRNLLAVDEASAGRDADGELATLDSLIHRRQTTQRPNRHGVNASLFGGLKNSVTAVFGIETYFMRFAKAEVARLNSDMVLRLGLAESLLESRVDSAMQRYRATLRVLLLAIRERFGPRRGFQWKTLDFCLLVAIAYSTLFFFIGFLFLGGSPNIGQLEISYLEVGNGQASTLGVVPVFILIYLIHYGAQYLLRIRKYPRSSRAVDAARLLLSFSLSVVVAFVLALKGFGAGFVALSVAVGAWHVRSISGAGILYILSVAATVAALWLIVSGAEAGDEKMINLSQALHGLIRGDVYRFFLLWLLFPVVNSVYDYCSWKVSRRFALSVYGGYGVRDVLRARLLGTNSASPRLNRRIRSGKGVTIILLGSFDALIALLLLFGLLGTLTFAMELMNIASGPLDDTFDIRPTMTAFTQDPFGDGVWLTTILLTTLFPTSLHFAMIVFSIVRMVEIPVSTRSRWANMLIAGPSKDGFEANCRSMVKTILLRRYVAIPTALVLSAAVLGFFGYLLFSGHLLSLLSTVAAVGLDAAEVVHSLIAD